VKQYKTWTWRWGFRKNLKDKEKRTLEHKYEVRKAQNKETVFQMNGDVIPIEKIRRNKKGKRAEEQPQSAIMSPLGNVDPKFLFLVPS
jgi:hypothetical protein